MVTIPLTAFEKDRFKLVRIHNYDYDIAIQKNEDGTFTTLLLMCTHAGHPLTKTGPNYYCTLHGSQFTHEGVVTKGPAEKNLTHLKSTTQSGNLLIQLIKTS